ncbi:hypothetical protein WAK64_14400 [Bacillus spongiae]|uniref:Uncharacterized protein n=1 Tax=Bacillus spongiae TaxID=2683610 RepID=A0ABU8HGD2_9BACI
MLSVVIDLSNLEFVEELLRAYKFTKQKETYVLKKKNNIFINATINHSSCKLKTEFSPHLTLEQYEEIHDIHVHLIKELNTTKYDDRNSLLGYLQNGEKAYIITNWEKWYSFLQEAKYKSLEGKKVMIQDESKQELASGLFLSYDSDPNTAKITRCTVITLFGERTFKGDGLTIEPTNEW